MANPDIQVIVNNDSSNAVPVAINSGSVAISGGTVLASAPAQLWEYRVAKLRVFDDVKEISEACNAAGADRFELVTYTSGTSGGQVLIFKRPR